MFDRRLRTMDLESTSWAGANFLLIVIYPKCFQRMALLRPRISNTNKIVDKIEPTIERLIDASSLFRIFPCGVFNFADTIRYEVQPFVEGVCYV